MLETLLYAIAAFFLGWQAGTIVVGYAIANRTNIRVTIGLLPTLLSVLALVLALLV